MTYTYSACVSVELVNAGSSLYPKFVLEGFWRGPIAHLTKILIKVIILCYTRQFQKGHMKLFRNMF